MSNHNSLEIHPEALQEGWEARRWYSQRSPKAADEFWEELERAINQIEKSPDMWPTYVHGTQRYSLRRFPYVVVYVHDKEDDKIVILAIAHGKRCPGYWRDRMN